MPHNRFQSCRAAQPRSGSRMALELARSENAVRSQSCELGRMSRGDPRVLNSGRPGVGKSWSVLIVGENRDSLTEISDYLGDNGIDTRSVSGSKDIHRELSTADPDLVILYLLSGSSGGVDLLRRIRLYSPVPLIIIGH